VIGFMVDEKKKARILYGPGRVICEPYNCNLSVTACLQKARSWTYGRSGDEILFDNSACQDCEEGQRVRRLLMS